MRRFAVKVGGKERLVELGHDENGKPWVSVDGQVKALELDVVEAGAWLVREGEAQAFARVDGEGAKLTVALRRGGADVVVVPVEVTEARSAAVAALVRQARGAAAAGPASVSVRSPMPGRVAKILVRAGERVAAGHAVVVVEAMKMENELRAPRAGTVREIRCAEGAAVEAGQDLVIIEAAADLAPT